MNDEALDLVQYTKHYSFELSRFFFFTNRSFRKNNKKKICRQFFAGQLIARQFLAVTTLFARFFLTQIGIFEKITKNNYLRTILTILRRQILVAQFFARQFLAEMNFAKKISGQDNSSPRQFIAVTIPGQGDN